MPPFLIALLGGLFAALFLFLIIRSWAIVIFKKPETAHAFLEGYLNTAPLPKRAEMFHFLISKYCPICGETLDHCGGPVLESAPCAGPEWTRP